MKYFKKLVGARIYLSPMCEEDAETYTRWLNDFAVTDGVGTSARLQSVEEEKKWIREQAGSFQFAIVRLEDNQLLGNCGFQEVDHLHQSGVVGLFIGEEENRGKGYGTEALRLLLRFGFQYLNLHNIMLKVYSFNGRAVACYQKAGFREAGRRREAFCLRGKRYDVVFMDILKDEFEE